MNFKLFDLHWEQLSNKQILYDTVFLNDDFISAVLSKTQGDQYVIGSLWDDIKDLIEALKNDIYFFVLQNRDLQTLLDQYRFYIMIVSILFVTKKIENLLATQRNKHFKNDMDEGFLQIYLNFLVQNFKYLGALYFKLKNEWNIPFSILKIESSPFETKA